MGTSTITDGRGTTTAAGTSAETGATLTTPAAGAASGEAGMPDHDAAEGRGHRSRGGRRRAIALATVAVAALALLTGGTFGALAIGADAPSSLEGATSQDSATGRGTGAAADAQRTANGEAACPLPAPTTAAEVAAVFADAAPEVFTGGDGMLSAPLTDDRTLVITADTFTDPTGGAMAPTIGPGTFMRHNAAYLVDGGCLRSATTGELFPSTPATGARGPAYEWPNALVPNPDGSFTVFTGIMTTSPGAAANSFDFTRVGTGRHIVRVEGQSVVTDAGVTLPNDPHGITWGHGGGRTPEGMAVVYGTRPGVGGWDVFAARTTDPAAAPDTWEIATTEGWVRSGEPTAVATHASDVVGAMPGHAYTFVTKLGGAIGTSVVVATLDPVSAVASPYATVAESPTTEARWTYNPQFYSLTPETAAVIINTNTTQPGVHDRAAFSPQAVGEVEVATS